jgi:sterol desaturase/sphingolipid hydroxylase (fatty acid hydroxylase superfamily)
MALWVPLMALLLLASIRGRSLTWDYVLIHLVLGSMAWTLVEYALHRYVFHWVNEGEKWRAYSRVASGLHIAHHKSTDREDLIVAPPAVSLVFAALLYGIFLAASRSVAGAALLESGLIAGYLLYEWAHYSAHRFLPKSRLGQFLRKYHLQHHHKCPDRQFGVTTPLWDVVFRTR